MKVQNAITYITTALFCLTLSACNACTEQHDPRPARKQFKQEESFANRPQAMLNEDGSYPTAEEAGDAKDADNKAMANANQNPIKGKYDMYCSSCHGAEGAGDGAAAASLNPKPRSLTDVAWQEETTDERIYKVIKEGGASLGLSATMAPWGGVLSDEETQQMVDLVRSFAK